MKFFFKKKCNKLMPLVAVCNGDIVPTASIKDESFSQNMLGHTIGILPTDGDVVSPIDGKVEMLFPTGHAFSIKCKCGANVLVHIGIDTVNLNTNKKEKITAFTPLIKIKEDVKAGQPIIRVNWDLIKKADYDTTTMIVLVDDEELNGKKIINLTNPGKVEAGDQIADIE